MSYSEYETVAPIRTVEPTFEPISLTEARTHCSLTPTDSTHDETLTQLIKNARDQVEHDTQLALITSTWTETFDDFDDVIELTMRPVQSITSIVYKDSLNTTQTLSTSIYSLDAARRLVRLKYQQVFPVTLATWDAVTVTYVAGYTSAYNVPGMAKQAMLLLIGYYFENRDMLMGDSMQSLTAYNALIQRLYRSSYP
jgi:uncharacterized phiE125 gp8 family phage protein